MYSLTWLEVPSHVDGTLDIYIYNNPVSRLTETISTNACQLDNCETSNTFRRSNRVLISVSYIEVPLISPSSKPTHIGLSSKS